MAWLISNALMGNYLNSHCLQEQAAEFLVEICLDGKQSEQLSENHTQQAFCSQDRMTVYSRLSRFGMTFKPLEQTIPNVQDLLSFYAQSVAGSLSAAVSHAKTYQPQEKEQESQAKGQDYGKSLHGLLAKYDHVTHSLKTAQCSLIEDSTSFSVTLPRWGTMRNGACYQRQMLVQSTSAKEFGLLPTPKSTDGTKGSRSIEGCLKELRRGKNVDLTMAVKLFPTPRAFMHKESTTNRGKHNIGEVIGGKLNPTWTEWLMGWPLEWTDLKPLEMDRCHCVPQPRLNCLEAA